MGGGNWKLRAVLRNGPGGTDPNGAPYPGGGSLEIRKTSGATQVVEPPSPNYPAIPAPSQLLRSVPIPALAKGQTITTEVMSQGKAVFVAVANPVAGQDRSASNNRMEVSKLTPFSLTINGLLLKAFLAPVVDQFQLHLHKTGSFIELPGHFHKTFDVPRSTMNLPWPLGSAIWEVNDINLDSTTLGLADRALTASFNFETSGTEIVGWVDDGPDWMAPNVNASPLRVNVKLPLGYNSAAQCFFYFSPQVTVDANWNLNNLPDFLLPDINKKISNALKATLSDVTIKQRLEFELNKQVHAQLKGGRIVSVGIDPEEVKINVEFPS
jgi:hypothetical protein